MRCLLYSKLNSDTVLKATGCHKDHCKDGYLVFDMTLTDALSIGREYEQMAIFYNDGKKLMYIDCKKSEEMVVRSR